MFFAVNFEMFSASGIERKVDSRIVGIKILA